jgi:hypothetical protein
LQHTARTGECRYAKQDRCGTFVSIRCAQQHRAQQSAWPKERPRESQRGLSAFFYSADDAAPPVPLAGGAAAPRAA